MMTTTYRVKIMRNCGDGIFGTTWRVVTETVFDNYDKAKAYAKGYAVDKPIFKIVITDRYNRFVTCIA